MKKGLFLLCIASMFALSSVTARDDQNSGMNKITESVPTIKQRATVEMPFVITSHVQDTDFVVVENHVNFVSLSKSQPIFQLVCSSESPTLDKATALITWQSNRKLFGNDYNKRIPNLGFNYIEGRSTEYRNC